MSAVSDRMFDTLPCQIDILGDYGANRLYTHPTLEASSLLTLSSSSSSSHLPREVHSLPPQAALPQVRVGGVRHLLPQPLHPPQYQQDTEAAGVQRLCGGEAP